jgi:hypothetical protein
MDTRNGLAQPAIDIASIRIRFGSGSRAVAHRGVLVHSAAVGRVTRLECRTLVAHPAAVECRVAMVWSR